LVALSQLAGFGIAQALHAATSQGSSSSTSQSAQTALQKPITREEADQLLRQAHSAIEQGHLDDAEKVLSRVENAHVNFSVFHVGPTTESIRRELSRAQHLAHANGKSSKDSQAHQPFARTQNGSTKTPEDPFNTHRASGESKGSDLAGSASAAKSSRGLEVISAPDGLTPPPSASPYGKLETNAKLASNEIAAD